MEPKFKAKFLKHKGYQPIKFTFCVCLNRIVDFLAFEKWGVRSSFNCYLIRVTFIGALKNLIIYGINACSKQWNYQPWCCEIYKNILPI